MIAFTDYSSGFSPDYQTKVRSELLIIDTHFCSGHFTTCDNARSTPDFTKSKRGQPHRRSKVWQWLVDNEYMNKSQKPGEKVHYTKGKRWADLEGTDGLIELCASLKKEFWDDKQEPEPIKEIEETSEAKVILWNGTEEEQSHALTVSKWCQEYNQPTELVKTASCKLAKILKKMDNPKLKWGQVKRPNGRYAMLFSREIFNQFAIVVLNTLHKKEFSNV